jgi:hypothetical protein
MLQERYKRQRVAQVESIETTSSVQKVAQVGFEKENVQKGQKKAVAVRRVSSIAHRTPARIGVVSGGRGHKQKSGQQKTTAAAATIESWH